jgi:hypothetical protein
MSVKRPSFQGAGAIPTRGVAGARPPLQAALERGDALEAEAARGVDGTGMPSWDTSTYPKSAR